MTAPEVIYCGVSNVFDALIPPGGVARLLSIFTFESKNHRLFDPARCLAQRARCLLGAWPNDLDTLPGNL